MATRRVVVNELKRMVQTEEINTFTCIEINGLTNLEPVEVYCLLSESISGHDGAKEGHLRLYTKEYEGAHGPLHVGQSWHACLNLMDELNQLVTPKQDIVYNFFEWLILVGNKLLVVTVAMIDPPERAINGIVGKAHQLYIV